MKRVLLFCACVLMLSLFSCERQRDIYAPLRVGVLPDSNSLPFLLARDLGFFEQEGVQVELVPLTNPQERDAALQAGHLDGAISDVLAAAFFAAAGFDFRITSLTQGNFGIVGAPQSGITTLEGLRGSRIGLSLNTIIHYTVDSLLDSAGVAADEYEAVAIPQMLLRLEMLLSGMLDAAAMPDPLLTAAAAQGATLIATTEDVGIEAGILLFSQWILDNRLDDVKAFYRAYYRAAREINANPDAFRDFLIEQAAFPAAIRDVYRFAVYRTPQLPEKHQVIRALDWLRARNLLTADLSPSDLIDPRAISEWLN